MKRYKRLTEKAVNELSSVLGQQGLLLHHTGAMYGVGCNAHSVQAIGRINALKQRSDGKGYIVLIPDASWLKRYGVELHRDAARLLRQYWPGELTVILPVPDKRLAAVALDGRVGFRVPSCPQLRQLLTQLDYPLVSTSINLAGEAPLTTYSEIKRRFALDAAFVPADVDEDEAVPSTVIMLKDEEIECLREGAIPFEEIALSYRSPLVQFICTGNTCRSPMAEYYARHCIQQQGLPLRAESAGFVPGQRMISEHSFTLLYSDGIDARPHRSRVINKEISRRSACILTMTADHKRKLIELDPNVAGKTFTLMEFTGEMGDIDDPYGLDISFYRIAYNVIKERVELALATIRKEVE
jgi:tRNA threonylcarbamoyl adenosine modification protein (Sua5/YciO/YrdC/YwlC family)